MLDNANKTAKLVISLMAAVPFEVELTPEAITFCARNSPPSLSSRSKLSLKSPTLAMKEVSCAASIRRN